MAVLLFAPLPALAGLEEALAAYESGELRKAFIQFKHLAIRGDAEAQYQLGTLYALGQGVDRNESQALRWLRHAAEQAHRGAAEALAKMYLSGEGVERDEAAARKWLAIARSAADQRAQQQADECE